MELMVSKLGPTKSACSLDCTIEQQKDILASIHTCGILLNDLLHRLRKFLCSCWPTIRFLTIQRNYTMSNGWTLVYTLVSRMQLTKAAASRKWHWRNPSFSVSFLIALDFWIGDLTVTTESGPPRAFSTAKFVLQVTNTFCDPKRINDNLANKNYNSCAYLSVACFKKALL